MVKKPVKLAVFDIDGTVFRSSLLIELINQLVVDRIFPAKAKKEMEHEYLAWLNRVGTYENYLDKVVEIFYKNIKGVKKKELDKSVSRVINFHKDRVYRFTRDLVKKLKKQKYFLLTVSGSPMDIVEPFAKYLGFTAYQGRIFETQKGIFTGKVLNNELMKERKDKIITQFIKENELEVDLKNSIAVGDTEADITMLSLVGKPIAFNPNMNLAKIAKQKKWKVVVERKDVVFEVEEFSFLI